MGLDVKEEEEEWGEERKGKSADRVSVAEGFSVYGVYRYRGKVSCVLLLLDQTPEANRTATFSCAYSVHRGKSTARREEQRGKEVKRGCRRKTKGKREEYNGRGERERERRNYTE